VREEKRIRRQEKTLGVGDWRKNNGVREEATEVNFGGVEEEE